MLRQDAPGDHVMATGEMHTARELCAVAFSFVGLDPERHLRVDELRRDASKAAAVLGLTATTCFKGFVRMMLERDLREAGVDRAARMVGP
jgi:GDPmannose 4,6-dehydratase